MMELTKELISRAADQNVLIYDWDDKYHSLTYRLAELLKQHSVIMFGDRNFNYLYIGNDTIVEDYKYFDKIGEFEIIRDKRLNRDGEFTKYFIDDLKACMQASDE